MPLILGQCVKQTYFRDKFQGSLYQLVSKFIDNSNISGLRLVWVKCLCALLLASHIAMRCLPDRWDECKTQLRFHFELLISRCSLHLLEVLDPREKAHSG